MACFHPLTAYRAVAGQVTFDKRQARSLPLFLPCGQCSGCRLERARQWAVRCQYEAAMHRQNCFLTLTYDDDHLPEDGSLRVDHFQDFMKRLRKRVPQRIRFFHCGEYGEQTFRPHYHALIFGFDPDDKVSLRGSGETELFSSNFVDSVWQHGFVSVGAISFDSACYVARYCMKKVTGDAADSHYERVRDDTGELVRVAPEYATMSRRPGIGKSWFDRYGADVLRDDSVFSNGHPAKPPRYFDALMAESSPDAFEAIKEARKKRAVSQLWNSTAERLAVRETVLKAKLALKKRNIG